MWHSIRNRLVTVVVLGIVTSALSLACLGRILSLTTSQRLDRARDAVTEEARLIATEAAKGGHTLPVTEVMTVVAMRGGVWSGPAGLADVPASWRGPLLNTIAQHPLEQATTETPLDADVLVIAVHPIDAQRIAWAAYPLKPSPYLRFWQVIVLGLSMANALLATSALRAVSKVKNDARALNRSLETLAGDLAAPVERPSLRELADVADGIKGLAGKLAHSREEQERLARELAQRERLAALGRVVAGVAHEVRNPLASIKLRLDLAAAAKTLPPQVEAAIANASSEITRLDRLVADLLVVGGRAIERREVMPLGPLVRSRADALLPWSQERHVAIGVTGDADAPIDRDSMTRAIDNLLKNAVEASPPHQEVEVRVESSGGTVSVLVEDHGVGVSEERSAELFEPFFTTKSDGTGLGLAISRSIARAHGGDLTYERHGQVTRFALSFGAKVQASRESLTRSTLLKATRA